MLHIKNFATMEKISKEQFSYKKFVLEGKDINSSYPFADIGDSFEVTFDEEKHKYTAEITDIYLLNIFQFDTPKQEDLIKAKKFIIDNSMK